MRTRATDHNTRDGTVGIRKEKRQNTRGMYYSYTFQDFIASINSHIGDRGFLCDSLSFVYIPTYIYVQINETHAYYAE